MANSGSFLPDGHPSSSPPPSAVIFSDPVRSTCTTPPSSPPNVSIGSKTLVEPPTRNAFSVLGKRKVLSSVSLNSAFRAPHKKHALSSPSHPSKPISRPAASTASTVSRPNAPAMTQMQISCGQQMQKRCSVCGMEYVPSAAEDRRLHERFHRQNTEGYELAKGFVERVRREKTTAGVRDGVRPGDAICVVRRGDGRGRRRRAQEVLAIVQRELGAVEIPEQELWSTIDGLVRFRAYLYVRAGKCVGFLLAERIQSARTVEQPRTRAAETKTTSGTAGGTGALSALRARQEALAEAMKAPIRLSTRERPAVLGISRVWTSASHRREKIALALLDVAYEDAREEDEMRASTARRVELADGDEKDTGVLDAAARPVGKMMVAFSQPTDAGTNLARRWFGRPWGWPVYMN